MTLISSWGGPSANSYVSYTAADSYATTALINASNWTNATTAQREAALITASRDIDGGNFFGARYYHDQALEFPRRGRDEYPWGDQVVLETGESAWQQRMKYDVEIATVMQANYRLAGTVDVHVINRNLGIAGHTEKVGPLSETVNYGSGGAGGGGSFKAIMHPDALSILAKYRVGRRIWRG